MWDECPHPNVANGVDWSAVAEVLSVNPIDPFLVAALSHQIITIGGVRVWWPGLAIAGLALLAVCLIMAGPIIITGLMGGGEVAVATKLVYDFAYQ